MIIILVFILFIFIDIYLLPALVGPREFMITPILLMGHITYSKNLKSAIVFGLIFSFTWEILIGDKLGGVMIPYLLTLVVFIWLNKFIEIRSALDEVVSWPGILRSTFMIFLLTYIYAFFFIIHHSSYQMKESFLEWTGLLSGNILINTAVWALVLSIVFVLFRKRSLN